MVVDDLVMQGAKASAPMVLTQLNQNILVSATEGLRDDLTPWPLGNMNEILDM